MSDGDVSHLASDRHRQRQRVHPQTQSMTVFGLWVSHVQCCRECQRFVRFTGHQQGRGTGVPASVCRWRMLVGCRIHFQLRLSLDGLAQVSSNEYLVLAGTLHGIHAITSRLSPTGSSSGVQVIEAETFKVTILLTPTGERLQRVF